MDIKRSGSQPSGRGPAQFFTGNVRIDPLIKTTEPARVSGGIVTFEPGARSAWHTHPLGHLKRALENGITKDELIELITHLAFYSGWPTANSALPIARSVFQE